MGLTINSTVGELLADPKAREIMEKHLPGSSTNPSMSIIENMTLPDVWPMSGGKITEAQVNAIAEDLKKL